MKDKDLYYVDLFSGSGGLTLGFEEAGFKNVFSIDSESSFCDTYEKNFPSHKLIRGNVESLSKGDILELVRGKNVDVVVGGPPCQGFSIAGNIGRRFLEDPRNHLFKEFVRYVKIIKPKYFVMENVARLYTHNRGSTRDEILNTFISIGYENVECKILNSADYGVPQTRKRVIFIGSRDGKNILFPTPSYTEYRTVKDAIGDLPVINSGEDSKVPNHIAMNHSVAMLDKMRHVKDGGNRNDIPAEIRPQTGDARKYIRYNSSKPSVTVTGDMRKVFHYDNNRALTVRELARIQTYPDSFVFLGTSSSQQQQVGNSVPPLMAEAIAKQIKLQLVGRNK